MVSLRRIILLFISLIFSFFFGNGIANQNPSVSTDEVLANIGETQITEQELQQRLSRLPENVRQEYLGGGEAGIADFLHELVRIEVFSREARRIGLDQEPDIRKSIEDIAKAILSYQYVQREVLGKTEFSEQTLRKYYDSHRSDFMQPEQIKAPNILLIIPKGANAARQQEVEALATKIVEQLKGGADFTELEKRYSQDKYLGNHDYYSKGRWAPELEEKVFALKVGDVSPPIKVSNGYRIFDMQDRKPGINLSFEEARDRIVAILKDQAFKKAEQDLFKKYNVTFSEQFSEPNQNNVH